MREDVPHLRLSVIIPVYNEVTLIEESLRRVRAVELPLEVIVVDDGSTDGTRELLPTLAGIDRLILHDRNRGKGSAIRTGLEAVTGDVVVIQDADLEYDPRDFIPMLEKIEREGAQVVYGSRILGPSPRGYLTFYLGGRLLSLLTNVLYGTSITDEPTCYKMFRREVLAGIPLECDGFEFCPEVTAKVVRRGFRIVEVPIRYYPRGVSEGKKIRARDGWIAIWTLIRLRFARMD